MNESQKEQKMVGFLRLGIIDCDEDEYSIDKNILQKTIEVVLTKGIGHIEISKDTLWNVNNVLSYLVLPTIVLANLFVYIYSQHLLSKGMRPKLTYLLHSRLTIAYGVLAFTMSIGQFCPSGMPLFSLLPSIFSVGIGAVVHYLCLLQKLQYQGLPYSTRAQVAITVTWIMGCVIGLGLNYTLRLIVMIFIISIGALPFFLISAWFPFLIYFQIESGVVPEQSDEEYEYKSNEMSICMKLWNSRVLRAITTTTVNFLYLWIPYFFAAVLSSDCYDNQFKYCNAVGIAGGITLRLLTLFSNIVYPISFFWWHWTNM